MAQNTMGLFLKGGKKKCLNAKCIHEKTSVLCTFFFLFHHKHQTEVRKKPHQLKSHASPKHRELVLDNQFLFSTFKDQLVLSLTVL